MAFDIGNISESREHSKIYLLESATLREDQSNLETKMMMVSVLVQSELFIALKENENDFALLVKHLKLINGNDLIPITDIGMILAATSDAEFFESIIDLVVHRRISESLIAMLYSMVVNHSVDGRIFSIRKYNDEYFVFPGGDGAIDMANLVALQIMKIVARLSSENDEIINSHIHQAELIASEVVSAL